LIREEPRSGREQVVSGQWPVVSEGEREKKEGRDTGQKIGIGLRASGCRVTEIKEEERDNAKGGNNGV
jgi:hypothetical protein